MHKSYLKDSFKYLGSIIQGDREIEDDVVHRTGAGWVSRRLAFGVLCDINVSSSLTGKFYRVVVRPTLLYGAECWLVKNTHVQKMSVAEMRMLRWMCGCTRMDMVRNEVVQGNVEVAHVADKMREARLRWLGHVKKSCVDALVRRCERLAITEVSRGRGRPKKNWGGGD
ncbi:uncharacterized protein LOC132054118 [Lycium ferocissimum]|uniref:uncharacterized protein LOC132054118 n=1 Tax=Lycium ferocissimum TaxID=112874 RepID=UPI002815A2E9|nr:uncharacterized protein LOC132054118 [Lycium ferocissimum]